MLGLGLGPVKIFGRVYNAGEAWLFYALDTCDPILLDLKSSLPACDLSAVYYANDMLAKILPEGVLVYLQVAKDGRTSLWSVRQTCMFRRKHVNTATWLASIGLYWAVGPSV